MLTPLKISLKVQKVTLNLVFCYPLVWVAMCFVFFVECGMYLGYWPQPNQPDPQFVPFENQLNFLHGASFLLPISSLLSAFVFAQSALKRKLLIAICFHLFGWISIFVFMFVPKFNFIAWVLD